jgi:hypothetical protein
VSPCHSEVIPYRIDVNPGPTRVSSGRIDADPASRRPRTRCSRVTCKPITIQTKQMPLTKYRLSEWDNGHTTQTCGQSQEGSVRRHMKQVGTSVLDVIRSPFAEGSVIPSRGRLGRAGCRAAFGKLLRSGPTTTACALGFCIGPAFPGKSHLMGKP